MKLCNDVITILNSKLDPATGFDTFHATVITGVSWYGDTASTVDSDGLKAADGVTIRIPADADFGDKSFVAPSDYATSDPAKTFTLKTGDVIARGSYTTSLTPSELRAACGDVVTILGITDNRRAPRAPHWKVVGK